MKAVRAVIVVESPGIEVEQLWHDRARWASWIDGFTHLEKLEGEWPLEGSRRVYSSPGRSLVSERVIKYEAGSGLTLMVEDARTTAVQRVRFESDNVRTRITVEVEAEPKEKMAPGPRWWWRRKHGESLQRTLQRFSYELAADR
ncbi:SRPBCC family protein [Solirubrobacter taibaiensis]|nr:SRPBCC family protein [Solirubrobacter taibaiensis]